MQRAPPLAAPRSQGTRDGSSLCSLLLGKRKVKKEQNEKKEGKLGGMGKGGVGKEAD